MRNVLIAAALALGVVGVAIAAPPLFAEQFEWPQSQVGVIPDLRVADVVSDARNEAREAASQADAGKRNAATAKRIAGLRGMIGIKPNPVTVAAGTTMTAYPIDGEGGTPYGVMTYASGASMIGEFGGDTGILTASPESLIAEFRGWVYGAAQQKPTPMKGVFDFKNGESFTGSLNAENNARGIYSSVDGTQRFVGLMDLSGVPGRPLKGVMEDRRGRLLAIVGPTHPSY